MVRSVGPKAAVVYGRGYRFHSRGPNFLIEPLTWCRMAKPLAEGRSGYSLQQIKFSSLRMPGVNSRLPCLAGQAPRAQH
jgi:hypothetical protein